MLSRHGAQVAHYLTIACFVTACQRPPPQSARSMAFAMDQLHSFGCDSLSAHNTSRSLTAPPREASLQVASDVWLSSNSNLPVLTPMKRALSDLDLEPTLVPGATPPAKRLRPLSLTRKALSKIQVPQSESGASVNLWINSCTHDKRMDPNQLHPRLQAQPLRRAKARSRTPSPVKKPPHSATPEYRNGTMKLALVFIERDPELPACIASSVERILGRGTTRNASGHKGVEDTARDALEATLAETYRAQCRSLAGDCSGEGEWRSCIYSILMSPLSKFWSPILKISASEKRESIAATLYRCLTWLSME